MKFPRARWIGAAAAALVLGLGGTGVVTAGEVPQHTTATSSVPDVSGMSGAKVLVDTDFGQLNDDSQMLYLLTQAHADVLGVTTVSGNVWSQEATAYALRQLQLVHRTHVPVLQGAADPIGGSRQHKLGQESYFYGAVGYVGAWDHAEPGSYRHLAQRPYGGYSSTPRTTGSAPDFIAQQIKAHPHQVTLFVLGPATNVARAVRRHPEIVPLVKQVVYMGGAYSVPGNEGPAAEFNVWFDPVAAKIALNTPFPNAMIVPLDVTDTVHYGKAQYDRIVDGRRTPITREFRALQGPTFAQDPGYTTYIYDAITAAIFLQPDLVTKSHLAKVQVDTHYAVDFGHTLAYPPAAAPHGTSSARIVTRIDVPAFFNLYVHLMTAPVTT